MKNKTEIVVVMDRSGSMSYIKTDMEGGFNSFIEEQKKSTADEAVVSLVKFDTEVETEYQELPLNEVPPLNLEPRGSTALYDAVGKTINEVGIRLSNLAENDRPNKVIVVIITDGMENASTEFVGDQVKKMVEHQTEKYGWVFVFLGSNINAIDTANTIGIKATNAMTYASNSKGSKGAFGSISQNFTSYRSTGDLESVSFSSVQRSVQTDAGVSADLNVVK